MSRPAVSIHVDPGAAALTAMRRATRACLRHLPELLPAWQRCAAAGGWHLAPAGSGIATAAVDSSRWRLYVASGFPAAVTDAQRAFVVAHELLHPTWDVRRAQGRFPAALINQAHDGLINDALRARQAPGVFEVPDWALRVPAGYTGPRALEPLCAWMQAQECEEGGDPADGDGSGGDPADGSGAPMPGAGCGDLDPAAAGQLAGDDAPGTPPAPATGEAAPSGRDSGEAVAREIAQAAASLGSGARGALIPAPSMARIRWADLLRSALQPSGAPGRDAQTWARRGRRSPEVGAQLPGWQAATRRVCIVLDASGSMLDLLPGLASEAARVADAAGASAWLIVHDDRISYSGALRAGASAAEIARRVTRSGGTRFAPAYAEADRAAAGRPWDAVIHLTDGIAETPWPSVRRARRLIIGAVISPWTPIASVQARIPRGATAVAVDVGGAP